MASSECKKTYPPKNWEHIDLYYRTVGLGANTIINLPPDTRGLIPDDLAAAAKQLGDEIRKRFSNPIAQFTDIRSGETVELSWEKPQQINTVMLMENIANGQKIAQYKLEALVDGKWQPLEPRNRLVATPPYSANPGFQTIGHKKIDRVTPVTTNRLRFQCLESIAGTPELRSLAVFNNEPIIRTFDAEYPYLSCVDTTYDLAHRGLKRDISYRGETIQLGGKAYQRGLMLCPVKNESKGIAEFDMTRLPQSKATGFSATIGIEDATGENGRVEFIVEGKIGNQWEGLFRSKRLSGSSEPMTIQVSFPKGMTKLRLLVTDGGNGTNSDHAMWADAKFLD